MRTIKFLAVALFTFIAVLANAQQDAITRFFDKYLEDENFTVVYISPKMMQMVTNLSDNAEDNAEVKELLSGIKGIRILTTEVNPKKYYDEVLKTLQLKDYELLMQVRDKDENVRFLVKDKGQVVEELLLLVGGADEFVFMSFVGNIDMKSISKLGKSMDIEGMEHLEDLEEK